jgi:hypothetical protein
MGIIKRSFYFLLLLIWSIPMTAKHSYQSPQTQENDTITWLILNDLEYKESNHKVYGPVYLPEFSESIKKLNKNAVIIKGYIIPVDKDTWAISKSTFASCFFCGKSGPETVIGLTFKGKPGKLKMDAHATIKGKLILNSTDVDDWMYSMIDVEVLEIK